MTSVPARALEPDQQGSSRAARQLRLWSPAAYPERVRDFPQLRYMGSKYRLLPWLHEVFSRLEFDSALDAFAGSQCVSYLLKSMGKRVVSNDFLEFSRQIGQATIANASNRLSPDHCALLLADRPQGDDFIERTFRGIFYTSEDLRFLDIVWSNLDRLPSPEHRALALAALVRSCIKRQPRGVFTVAGDPDRYKDGRRDLRLSLAEHFLESVEIYNRTVFDNGRPNRVLRQDVFEIDPHGIDLVYMDPPYVPRSDDNCYIKRYHFIEGLASYWRDTEAEILPATKVKKIRKRYTPFSYRRSANEAFATMFRRFRDSILVLSYSSNGFPGLDDLVGLMREHKRRVEVFERRHRYHFGTHSKVSRKRVAVREYLIVGT